MSSHEALLECWCCVCFLNLLCVKNLHITVVSSIILLKSYVDHKLYDMEPCATVYVVCIKFKVDAPWYIKLQWRSDTLSHCFVIIG